MKRSPSPAPAKPTMLGTQALDRKFSHFANGNADESGDSLKLHQMTAAKLDGLAEAVALTLKNC